MNYLTYFVLSCVLPCYWSMMFTIQPQVIEIGSTISLNCSIDTPKSESELLRIAWPGQLSGRHCTADCFQFGDCNYDIDPGSCECDSTDTDVGELCPDLTKSVSYSVTGVSTEMSGDWVCEFETREKVTYFLQVYEQSDNPTLAGNFNMTINTNESITCSSKGGLPPAQFQWFIDDGNNQIDVTQNSTTTNGESVLYYTAQRAHNGSDIVCKVTQEVVPDERFDRRLLTVMYPPLKATATSTEVITAVNKSTILECFIEEDDMGYPNDYVYLWKRNSDTTLNEITPDGILFLMPYDVGFEDTYSCHPQNFAGQGLPAVITLKIKVPPTVSQLNVNQNVTSTAMPLFWFLNSTGGSLSLVFTLSYYSAINQRINLSLQNYGNDGDHIYYDATGLQPNTTYHFVLIAEDELDSLYSECITALGSTRASPFVNLYEATFQTNLLIVLWDYSLLKETPETKVTVCFQYWSESIDSVFYPTKDVCDIPINIRTATISGNFQSGILYDIKLSVYENGYPGSTSGNQYLNKGFNSTGFPTVSDIVAITIAVLFLVLVVLFIVMVYFGLIQITPLNQHFVKRNHKEDTYRDTGAQNDAYEIPEKPADCTEQLEGQTYAQLEEYTNVETILE